jgi:hypothetical protein
VLSKQLPAEDVSVKKAARPELREAFDTAFIAPFASHHWASACVRSHWVELEGWQDSMAGPLSAIANTGGCEYVYSRQDWYFGSVSDPASLRSRLLEWHGGLVAGVERFAPASTTEVEDLAFMRGVAARMRELVERACEVERARWSAEVGSG